MLFCPERRPQFSQRPCRPCTGPHGLPLYDQFLLKNSKFIFDCCNVCVNPSHKFRYTFCCTAQSRSEALFTFILQRAATSRQKRLFSFYPTTYDAMLLAMKLYLQLLYRARTIPGGKAIFIFIFYCWLRWRSGSPCNHNCCNRVGCWERKAWKDICSDEGLMLTMT